MAESSSVKVVDCCRVSLPTGFIPKPSLPLTFFDIIWLPLSPIQRVFFYTYQQTSTHFMNTTIPYIKHSLSLTLQHYYPLAGTLTWPRQETKPHICCRVDDSVELTVTESNQDFGNLVGNHARDVNEFYPLVPKLPSSTNTQVQVPVMALQVTLFPNNGICIGITFLHVIADGKSIHQFIKSWASVCNSGLGDTSCLKPEFLPFYDRSVIHDPYHLETAYLTELVKLNFSPKSLGMYQLNFPTHVHQIRATFRIGPVELQKLKSFVLKQFNDMYNKDIMISPTFHVSKFVLTCAYVWVCLNSVWESDHADDGDMSPEYLVFPMECRERLNSPIPNTYFGNCLIGCFVEVKKSDLVGKGGIVVAAAAIGNAIQRVKEEGVLEEGRNFFTKFKSLVHKQRVLSIAGSPKLGVYSTDFGWGMPKKSEVISIDRTGAISLNECPDGKGGLEIGLVLNKLEMDAFAALFRDTLVAIP